MRSSRGGGGGSITGAPEVGQEVNTGGTELALGTKVGVVDIGVSVEIIAVMGLFVGIRVITTGEGASVSPSSATMKSKLDNTAAAFATVFRAEEHFEPSRQLTVTEEE